MAASSDSALVLLRSLWNKHVLLLRPQMLEARRAVTNEMARRGIAASGYAVAEQCDVAARHLESVLRATLKDFHDRARPDRRTRRYIASGDAQKHLKAMLDGEAEIAFGKLGTRREGDFAHVGDRRKRTMLHLETVVESELGVIGHKLHAPALDRKFWAEKGWAVGIGVLAAAGGWVMKVLAESPAGQKLINAVLHALRLK